MAHKYIEELKKKYADDARSHNIVDPSTLGMNIHTDHRAKRWAKQKIKYGFDDRETWAMDYTFYCWLYEHLKMFKEICCIDLNYHKFEYEGEELTQGECIDRMLEGCELYIAYDDSGWGKDKLTEEEQKKIDDVIKIWGIVIPAMWW